MTSRRTVFVLGAAANKEIDHTQNMPVGSELALRIQQSISSELNSGTRWPSGPVSDSISRQIGGLNEAHIQALRRIEQGVTFKESIDEFIDEWKDVPHLSHCGKLAICNEILSAEAKTLYPELLRQENGSHLSFRSVRESWLGQIFRFANPGKRRRDVEECLDGISFITFNYDRLLEAALYSFIRYGQNIDDANAVRILKSIPILHAYGSLGDLALPDNPGIELGSKELWCVERSAKGIRTFTEEIASEHRERMVFEISRSDRIVFLGFGFHRRNLDLIMPESISGNKHAIATGIGLRDGQLTEVKNRFARIGKEIKIFPMQCSELIDQQREVIFGS